MANSLAYGTITITDLSDGAQIWTTTVAPTTPDYTFTITDLNTDGNADIKVGDLIFYDIYRYTVTSVGETTVLGSYRTNMRGTGIWKITTAPTTPSGAIQGTYPDAVYVIRRATAISESGANEILVGDILEYDTYHYQVLHNDSSSSSYIILGERVNFKGNDGISVVSVTSSNNQDDGGTSTITVTYSDGNTDVFYVKNGNAGTSSEWYYGTDLVHTSGTETKATSITSGVTTGSMYLNTDTSLVYKCTAISQDGTLATWTYAGDLKTGVLDNIQIGGRNLMWNTLLISDSTDLTDVQNRPCINGHMKKETTEYGYAIIGSGTSIYAAEHGVGAIATSAHYVYLRFGTSTYENGSLYDLTPGDTYTMSFDAKWKFFSGTVPEDVTDIYMSAILYSTKGASTSFSIDDRNNFAIISRAELGTEMSKRCEFTFTIPANATTIYILIRSNQTANSYYAIGDYLELQNIKLEAGNFATSWTPAPEDVSAGITNASDTADTARQEIQDVKDEVSTIEKETIPVITEDIESLKNNKANASDIKTLQDTIRDNSLTVDQRLAALDAYNKFIEGYLHIDGENGVIDLGKRVTSEQGAHDFHLVLEGQRLVFYDGETAMAYFHNTQLYAPDSIFEKRAKIGRFAFINRSSGNLSFMYVGGAE